MTQHNEPDETKFDQNVRRITEEIEVTGSQLVDRVKEVMQEGNARRLILRNEEGRTLFEVPLTAGAFVGGALLWFNPLLAGIAAIGGMLLKVRIEIERDVVDSAEDMVEDAGDAVKDTARKVKHAAKNTMDDVNKAMDNADAEFDKAANPNDDGRG